MISVKHTQKLAWNLNKKPPVRTTRIRLGGLTGRKVWIQLGKSRKESRRGSQLTEGWPTCVSEGVGPTEGRDQRDCSKKTSSGSDQGRKKVRQRTMRRGGQRHHEYQWRRRSKTCAGKGLRKGVGEGLKEELKTEARKELRRPRAE